MDSQFNAIDYAHELVTAGVPQAQADVHARALALGLSTCAATKGDLAALEHKLATRMDLFETRIDARLNAFEAKINARLDAFEAERKYDRRLVNLVLALQLALIAKAFFF
jgi:hypothetical protein